MEPISTLDSLLRLGAAALCGAPIGWERGRNRHSAGLRTQILISCGTAAFVIISLRWKPQMFAGSLYQLDPMRVLQGIMAGVGLLAGGALIQSGRSVHGFTTASSVWAVAAVGAACGFAQYDLAIALSVLTVLVTGLLVKVDPKDHDLNIDEP